MSIDKTTKKWPSLDTPSPLRVTPSDPERSEGLYRGARRDWVLGMTHFCSWPSIAQTFIGLFFIGAGLFKLENYFLVGDQSLTRHFQFWIDNGWPPSWSLPLFHWGQLHPLPLSALVIALQITSGILLVLHWHRHLAASLLLLVQTGIFLGTFHHRGFNEFVGTSLWVALFYLFKPEPSSRHQAPCVMVSLPAGQAGSVEPSQGAWCFRLKFWWPILTYLFIGIALLQLYNRFVVGDPWMSSVPWQIEHLSADVMSIHPLWKNFSIMIAQTSWGKYLWLASWWIQLACVLGFLTRFRLYSGALLLCLWFLHIWTWMNGITSQGVLWLLATLVWVTEEHQQRNIFK